MGTPVLDSDGTSPKYHSCRDSFPPHLNLNLNLYLYLYLYLYLCVVLAC